MNLFRFFLVFWIIIYIYGDEEQKNPYRFIKAKTGLTLREKPDTDSESLGNIPEGKIVKVLEVLDTEVNLKGKISKWAKVSYSYKEGYVVNSFLEDDLEEENEVILKKEDILGKWKGDWHWGKSYTSILFKKNNFKAELFAGGDESAYTGYSKKGTWKLNPEKNPTEVCLNTKEDHVCFFIYNKKLIVNMNHLYKDKKNHFLENFDNDILSGLVKEK